MDRARWARRTRCTVEPTAHQYWGYHENPFWNRQFNRLNRRGFNFFGVWDHAVLNDTLADREAGIAP
jgi:hypothetical protein